MVPADHVLLTVGLAVIVLGLSSRVVKAHALSPVLLALAVGVLVGPHVLGAVEPTAEVPRHVLLEQTARVALALSVVDIALRLRPDDLRANARRLAVLLVVVMPGMWLVTGLGAWLVLGLPVAVALVLAAALTPTDPGVASALVTGSMPNRMLPRRVRMSLQGEAAANDGLALPFVLLAGALATASTGRALGDAAAEIGQQLGVALVVGLAAGWLAVRVTDWAGVRRLAEEDWFPLAPTGLALAVLGLAHLLGGSGILAAFVAGLVFAEGVPEGLREPMHEVHRSVTKLALTVCFLAFGTTLPVDRWPELGGAGLAFALWVVLLRRLPVAAPSLRATSAGWLTAGFVGWAGPLGAAGIYYLAFAHRFGLAEYERLFLAGSLAITASVLVQAATAAVSVRAYHRAAGAPDADDDAGELVLEGRLP